MATAKTSLKARVMIWLVQPQVLNRLAHANDIFHWGLLVFMVVGFHAIGYVWHALFIMFVVRSQLAFKGCPLTQLSNFLRDLSGVNDFKTPLRQGLTATLYRKHGKRALPLIITGWTVVVILQNLALILIQSVF